MGGKVKSAISHINEARNGRSQPGVDQVPVDELQAVPPVEDALCKWNLLKPLDAQLQYL